MPSKNLWVGIGRTARKAELRQFTSGRDKATFGMVTDDGYMKDGQWVKRPNWHNIVAWGDLATRISETIDKGTQIAVEGRVTYRKYEKGGETKYITEIEARSIQNYTPPKPKADAEQTDILDEDSDSAPY